MIVAKAYKVVHKQAGADPGGGTCPHQSFKLNPPRAQSTPLLLKQHSLCCYNYRLSHVPATF